MRTDLSRSITKIDPKYFKYDYVEERIVPLLSQYTGGAILQPNQRLYFGPNSKLKGRRIVGINLFSPNVFAGTYNGCAVVQDIDLAKFTLTIINSFGKEQVVDYPLVDLNRTQFNTDSTFGLTRIFNIIHCIEKSYIKSTVITGFAQPTILVLNFYTTND